MASLDPRPRAGREPDSGTEPSLRLACDLSKAADSDGIGTWQCEVARALAELAEESAEGKIELVGRFDTGRAVHDPQVRQAAREALGDAARAWTWSDPGAPLRADAFVSSSWGVPAALTRSPLETLLVYVVHDLTFWTHPEFHTSGNRLACTDGILRARFLARSHFVAVSEATARELRRRLEPDKAAGSGELEVSVVPNGVGSRFCPRPRDEVQQRLAARLEPSGDSHRAGEAVPEYVLFVGSFEPRKNLTRLAEAHRRLSPELRARHPLWIAGGRGWKLDALRAELEADPRVRFLGTVDDDLLIDLYNGAALFVYPSLAEGFGLPVAEAMACGTAVLTSSISSLPEVAGDAAALVDPLDTHALSSTLERLLADPAARRRLERAGPPRAARFAWQATARGLVRAVRSQLRFPPREIHARPLP